MRLAKHSREPNHIINHGSSNEAAPGSGRIKEAEEVHAEKEIPLPQSCVLRTEPEQRQNAVSQDFKFLV